VSRGGKGKHPFLRFLLSVPAGIGLGILLTLLSLKLPQGAALLLLGAGLAAGLAFYAWALKRKDRGYLEVFALIFSLLSGAALSAMARKLSTPVNLVEPTPLFLGLAVGIGLLGGGLCLWLIGLDWRYGDDNRKRPIWAGLLITGLVALGSFGFGMNLLSGVVRLADTGVERTVTAAVVELERERHSYGRFGSSASYYAAVTETEWTGEGERLSLSRETYEALTVGGPARILLHPGILGVPWLECVPLANPAGER